MLGLILFIACSLAVCAWGIHTNHKTFTQRISLIPVPSDPEFWQKMQVFKSVSYGKHHWYLMTFRDPLKLYKDK